MPQDHINDTSTLVQISPWERQSDIIWTDVSPVHCGIFVSLSTQGKSEGFDSCDRPSNLTQIGFKSSIFQPVWPWNLMDDPKKQ